MTRRQKTDKATANWRRDRRYSALARPELTRVGDGFARVPADGTTSAAVKRPDPVVAEMVRQWLERQQSGD